MAKKVTIPAVVQDVADDDILVMQLLENVQREGVPFMEEAYALRRLRDAKSMDNDELAAAIGKSPAYVHYQLKLCEMSEDARLIAEKGWITKTVAWEICKLKDLAQQTQAANDMARTKVGAQITASGAKNYIRDTFGDSPGRQRKERVAKYGPGSDYASNWKKYLITFSIDQFERFKNICRGRTETAVLAEAVDLVMRRDDEAVATA